MLLALAVGAKLYPIVLIPMFVLIWSRTRGRRWAAIATTAFLAVAIITLWPMVPAKQAKSPQDAAQTVANGAADAAEAQPQDPSGGLKAFLGRWEMNDFLFLLVVENLKPAADVKPAHRAWFSIVPEPWKATLLATARRRLELAESRTAFILARLFTAMVFALIGGLLLWQARSSDDPAVWLRLAFLTLAWLWLLSPTQNPWYWTWALPLVMFANSRAWLAVSGLALIYYLRFWLIYHWPEQPLLGTPYAGAALFDYVVTWIEFGPWLLWLTWEAGRRSASGRGLSSGDPTHGRFQIVGGDLR